VSGEAENITNLLLRQTLDDDVPSTHIDQNCDPEKIPTDKKIKPSLKELEQTEKLSCQTSSYTRCRKTSNIVYEDKFFIVESPDHPLNCRDDGGHLIMSKKVGVFDRSDMTTEEAIDFMRISMMVGKSMYRVLDVERMNYEDLANWGLDAPGGPRMHLHFFGRAKRQIHQIRGQHIALFPKGHPIYEGHLKPFTTEEIMKLRTEIDEISHEEKYVKMAELVGL
jgi:diadenosine tetraphosphate (Ap4A) HIT family hydrolase